MSERKHHAEHSGCALAMALDIIGDHWTLLIIRDLGLLGRHEFKEMLAGAEGISTNILTNRLKKLEASGIIAWRSHPADKKRKLYYLLGKGRALIPLLIEAFAWSEASVEGAKMPDRMRKGLAGGREAMIDFLNADLDVWENENL